MMIPRASGDPVAGPDPQAAQGVHEPMDPAFQLPIARTAHAAVTPSADDLLLGEEPGRPPKDVWDHQRPIHHEAVHRSPHLTSARLSGDVRSPGSHGPRVYDTPAGLRRKPDRSGLRASGRPAGTTLGIRPTPRGERSLTGPWAVERRSKTAGGPDSGRDVGRA